MTNFFFYNYFKNIENINKINIHYSIDEAYYFRQKNFIKGVLVKFDSNLHNVLNNINNLNEKEKFSNKEKYTVEEIYVKNKINNKFVKCWILH